MTSWPWPIDTDCTSFFFFFARPMISSVGSEPIERMQMKGVLSVLSACITSMLRGCESTYLAPSVSEMYSWATIIVRSMRIDLMSSSLCNLSSLSAISGTCTFSGASWSYHCCQSCSFREMSSGRSLNTDSFRDSSKQFSQTMSGIQGFGFLRSVAMSRAAPPLRKQSKWSWLMTSETNCTFSASSSANTSLCFSNRPRPM
mmetsp:Transcript_53702/g.127676  ORF Transcript_53702/g.127676 Transcript_53702/m.127676 type:complete len:201 (+) Transcript_53702:1884-2486(+)